MVEAFQEPFLLQERAFLWKPCFLPFGHFCNVCVRIQRDSWGTLDELMASRSYLVSRSRLNLLKT